MTVMKIKSKYKITPQIHKEIEESAKVLPPLVRLNKDGSDRMRAVTKTYKGSELPPDYKPRPGVKFDSSKNYFVNIQEPVYVNHKVEMINEFWKGGEPAVKNYINKVVEISKKNRNELKAK